MHSFPGLCKSLFSAIFLWSFDLASSPWTLEEVAGSWNFQLQFALFAATVYLFKIEKSRTTNFIFFFLPKIPPVLRSSPRQLLKSSYEHTPPWSTLHCPSLFDTEMIWSSLSKFFTTTTLSTTFSLRLSYIPLQSLNILCLRQPLSLSGLQTTNCISRCIHHLPLQCQSTPSYIQQVPWTGVEWSTCIILI